MPLLPWAGRPATFALLLCTIQACGGGARHGADAAADVEVRTGDLTTDAPPVGPPDDLFATAWWPVGDESMILELLHESPFFQARPHLITEMSAWFHEVVHEIPGEEPQSAERLGYYGIGNGVAFAFAGTWYPLNTLHELIGPEYDNGELGGYFSDFRARVRRNGLVLPWTREWIWRPRKAAIPMTRMQVEGPAVELVTLAFAPMAGTPTPAGTTLVEILLVRNTGTKALSGLTAELASYAPADVLGAGSLEQARGGDRMRVRPLDDDWSVLTTGPPPPPHHQSPAFDLEPGAERAFAVVYEFVTDGDPLGAGFDAVSSQGWETLLDETWTWWTGWHEQGLGIRTPDRRVDDLVEGLKETIRLQVGANGAVNQMSHYTGAWQRDVYPPVRVLAALGYLDDAWMLADYMYGAASVLGSIANRLPADLEIPDPIPTVDWLAQIPFTSDRLRGEGPSYLPLMHTITWRHGGGGDRLATRWDYLIHALRGQTISDEGMLYFSGDETFRPTFSANIGLGLDYPFEHETWSAYSAFVFVAACEELARAADHEGLDRPEDIAWLQDRAAWVRARTEAAYWLDDAGRYSPFIRMDTGVPDTHCSPDVNSYPLFIGYLDRDAPRARENIESCMDLILQENGMLQNISGQTEIVMDVDIGQGVYATPGPPSFLYSVADLNLGIASETFDTLGTLFSPSGNLPEVGWFPEPGRAISPLYDPSSDVGELWSRFRLWEGAVSLEAVLHYLVGYQADVIAGWAALAPHLPHGEGWIEADRMRFGPLRLSMRWALEDDGSHLLTLTPDAAPAAAGLAELRLRLTVPGTEVAAVEVDGAPLAESDYDVRSPFDGASEIRLTLSTDPMPAEIRIR